MTFSIYFLLISCLSIMIGETSPLPDKGELERIAIEQLNIIGSQGGISLKLLKGGEIYRNERSWKNVLVWKGTYNKTIDVAIKIVSDEHLMQKERNAFEILKATKDFDIKKHRIPRVYYCGPILNHQYFAIAMTLFEENLQKRCAQLKSQNKRFSEPAFLLIFKQAVESLRYIHSKNLAHNKIWPENIFIRGNDVFIAAFDESTFLGDFINDYKRLMEWLWEILDIDINISNDKKLKHLQNKIVQRAFESILKTKTIDGRFDILPNYEKIIKISDQALAKLGGTSGPLQVEGLKEGKNDASSLSSSSSGGCFFSKKSAIKRQDHINN